VLQLGGCDQTTDNWQYYQSGNFNGLALGPDNEYMACWDTGTEWDDPYEADGDPLRKEPLDATAPGIGCVWYKVPA